MVDKLIAGFGNKPLAMAADEVNTAAGSAATPTNLSKQRNKPNSVIELGL